MLEMKEIEAIKDIEVSVAMPVYNGAPYIAEQVFSITKQLKEKDELIISYDISKDKTWEIITQLASEDKRIRIVQNSKKGIVSNFNNALQECKGKYIFISDQDDIWVDNKILNVIETFEKTGAGLVIHNGIHINNLLQPISSDFFSMYRIGPSLIKNFLKPRYSGCCMAISNKLKPYILPIPENIDAYDHWIGMAAEINSKVYYLNEVLLFHRLHNTNYTPVIARGWNKIIRSRWILFKNIVKYTMKWKSYHEYS